MDYFKSIIFPAYEEVTIDIKGHGPRLFKSYEELEIAFKEGEVHPGDLKPAGADAINKLI